jgi:hypothetical protein
MAGIAKRMITVILALMALIIIAAAIVVYVREMGFVSHFLPFAGGAVLGAGINVMKVFLLDRAVNKAVGIEEGKSGAVYMRLQYFVRFILTGVVLVGAVLISTVLFWGAAAGVLTNQLAAYSMKFFYGREVKAEEAESKIQDEV